MKKRQSTHFHDALSNISFRLTIFMICDHYRNQWKITLLDTLVGFTLEAKLLSSEHSTSQVHLKIDFKSHFRKLGLTPDDKEYYLKHFRSEISHTYHKCVCSTVKLWRNDAVGLRLKSNTAIAATRSKRTNDISDISLKWLNKEIAVGLYSCFS